MAQTQWEVVVGNVGTVYAGTNRAMALEKFATYVECSQADYGRASGENVVLLQNSAIVKEFIGKLEDSASPLASQTE